MCANFPRTKVTESREKVQGVDGQVAGAQNETYWYVVGKKLRKWIGDGGEIAIS